MKFIKAWKLFLEQDENQEVTDDINTKGDNEELLAQNDKQHQRNLDQRSENLKYFQSKKQKVQDLFKQFKYKSDAELKKQIRADIFKNVIDETKHNSHLKIYVSIFWDMRRIQSYKNTITKSQNDLMDLRKDMSELQDDFNKSDDEKQKANISEQIEKTRKAMKDTNQKILDNQKKLSLDKTKYDDKRKKFEQDMKIELDEINKLSQK